MPLNANPKVSDERPIYTHRYGFKAYEQLNDLEVELRCYQTSRTPEYGGLGLAGHFKNIALMLYGPKSRYPFEWNPWADKMNECVHKHPITGEIRPHLGVSGCASSNKSHFFGLFAIINWLCDPKNAYVFVTSTSLSESRHRVWKSIVKFMDGAPGLPGRLVDSQGKICTIKEDGRHDDTAGIFLIAGAPSKAREAIGKLIGKKNKRVIFIADELPELSPAIVDAFYGNLSANPITQFVAMGNFKERHDPFGEFVEPKAGYDSINVETDEWETKRGYCIRFDGMKSPNILLGRDEYPYIYGSKQLKTHKNDFGENSAMFWRMCRSFEAPIGMDNCIYTEAELGTGKAYESPIWIVPPIKCSSLDPSYTNGGDRCFQWIGNYGQTIDGIWTIHFEKPIPLRDDATVKLSRDYQIVRKFRDNCIAFGVQPEHAATDVTGAGAPFYSIICEEWSNKVLPVNFSGSPSELFVRVNDTLTAQQQFDRRVSELWWVGKEFLKYGQLKGVTPSLARELKARHYETVKGADGLKVKVETKPDMKLRLGFSPDEADSAMVLIDLCRQRLGALAGGVASGQRAVNQSWQKEFESVNNMYANVNYEEPEYAMQ